MRSSAVLFDFDDTIVNTIHVRFEAVKNYGLEKFSKIISDDDLKALWGTPINELFTHLFGPDIEIEQVRQEYFKYVTGRYPTKLLPTVRETIEALSRNFHLGIVTSGGRDIVEMGLESNNLPKSYFHLIHTADETIYHKPDPRVFDHPLSVLKEVQVSPSKVTYIGDSLNDYHAAKSAGINFIGVTTGLIPRKKFLQHNIPSVDNLSQILELV